MTSISLHPVPRLGDVVREQIRAVELGLRREALFFLALLGTIAAFGISVAVREAGRTNHAVSLYGPGAAIPIALVGLLIPLGVWRDEGPARRAYHWAMPVARVPHAIARVGAGWIWLAAGVAIYVPYVAGLSALMNSITGAPQMQSAIPAWHWAVPFTAGTVGYLFGSAAVIGSDHPIRWIGGLWIALLAIIGFLEPFGMSGVRRALVSIFSGDYGMGAVVAGGTKGMGPWLIATLLWSVVGAAILCVAMYRRADR